MGSAVHYKLTERVEQRLVFRLRDKGTFRVGVGHALSLAVRHFHRRESERRQDERGISLSQYVDVSNVTVRLIFVFTMPGSRQDRGTHN